MAIGSVTESVWESYKLNFGNILLLYEHNSTYFVFFTEPLAKIAHKSNAANKIIVVIVILFFMFLIVIGINVAEMLLWSGSFCWDKKKSIKNLPTMELM